MEILIGIYAVLVLACLISAQHWAKKCRDELREIKDDLRQCQSVQNSAHRQFEDIPIDPDYVAKAERVE